MKRFVLSAVAVVAACTVAAAQGQRQPGGTRTAASLLPQVVSNKDLQADLKVSDEQKGKFKDVAAKLAAVQKKQQELFTGGAQVDREKMTEVRAEMTKVNEEVTKAVTDVLSDEQKKRVKQIEVQQMGVRAFSNEAVVKELALTEDQKKKIVEINNEVMQAIGRGTGGRPQPGTQPDAAALAEARKKRAEATEKAMAKVAAELTDAQKTTWKGLTGEKFDLTKLSAFGGGRPMRNDQ